ncbi:hypothetical protein ATANTOWER_032188 [Ataeniobius toweri]|uniref:Secreted protein n=1 Tax=Ataeniobius toweri TaxID=208326 RepID=A0ABU7AUS1_9TELE|nr:hypothetical protein [Ataeniobius toweri]
MCLWSFLAFFLQNIPPFMSFSLYILFSLHKLWSLDAPDQQSVIFYTTSSIVGHREAGDYLQQSMGGRQGTPRTGCQSITRQTTMHTQFRETNLPNGYVFEL